MISWLAAIVLFPKEFLGWLLGQWRVWVVAWVVVVWVTSLLLCGCWLPKFWGCG